MSRDHLALILALVLIAVARLIRFAKRWLDQAALDRRREEDESRDWLDVDGQQPGEPGDGDDDQPSG